MSTHVKQVQDIIYNKKRCLVIISGEGPIVTNNDNVDILEYSGKMLISMKYKNYKDEIQ